MRNRLALWATLLMVVALVLSGCAPRLGAGSAAALAEDPTELVIDLPALVVDIQMDGSPSIGNVPVAQLGQLAGVDLSTLRMDPAMVQWMVDSNIQHIQVDNTANELLVLVNGQPIPSIKYEGADTLVTTAEVLSEFGLAIPMAEKILPVVQKLGVAVIVRFPVQPGTAVIPFVVEAPDTAMAAKEAQDEFLAAVGAPPRINLPLWFNEDGSWALGGLTAEEWQALTGIPFSAFRMDPNTVRNLAMMGIETLVISTDQEGIHIAINGKQMPTLDWSDGKALHLINVADQLGLWDMMAPGMDMGEILAAVRDLLPVVQTADVDLILHLPSKMAAAR